MNQRPTHRSAAHGGGQERREISQRPHAVDLRLEPGSGGEARAGEISHSADDALFSRIAGEGRAVVAVEQRDPATQSSALDSMAGQ